MFCLLRSRIRRSPAIHIRACGISGSAADRTTITMGTTERLAETGRTGTTAERAEITGTAEAAETVERAAAVGPGGTAPEAIPGTAGSTGGMTSGEYDAI